MENKTEKLFDDICSLKMTELVELTGMLKSRLNLRVIGAFASAVEQTADALKPAPELRARVVGYRCSKLDAVRSAKALAGLGLAEAKRWVESLPQELAESDSPEQAQALAKLWADAGFDAETF